MTNRIKRKKRRIGIETAADLVDFFGLFGLSVSVDDRGPEHEILQVVSRSGAVAVCEGWEKFDHPEKLQFTHRKGCSTGAVPPDVVKSIVESLSSKRYLSWEDSSVRGIPFGSETGRTKTRIDLPDFSSVSELRILMAAEGV